MQRNNDNRLSQLGQFGQLSPFGSLGLYLQLTKLIQLSKLTKPMQPTQLAKLVLLLFLAGSADACDQTLNPGANVASAVTSAAAGSTICLNNGNYNGFTLTGVTKNPRVTVRAVNSRGAAFTSQVTLQGNTNGLTIEGVNLRSVNITGANTREITLRDFNGTGQIDIHSIMHAAPNILLDTFSQLNLNVADANTAGVAVDGSRSTPIATIRNATIDGGCADGIRIATPVIIEESRIMNKQVGNCPNDPHTDAVQFYGGPVAGTIIRGNYFYRNVQVLAAYDGVEGVLIENNVFDPGPDGERRPCQIELYSDANSIVRHNTLLFRSSGYGHICLDRKSQDDAGFGTIVVDNIATSIVTSNGSTFAQRHHNLVRSGASAGDILGSPTYTGGALPATWAGYALTSNSLGKNAASDGLDIGATTFGTGAPSASACDLNADGSTNVSDVQLCANQAIGVAACSTGDINRDGTCNVVDVQRVVNSALGGTCATQ